MKALKEGIFTMFFSKQDKELQDSVESFFNDYFAEIFEMAETPGKIDKTSVINLITTKLSDDEGLLQVLISEFDKFEPEDTQGGMITQD